MPKLERTILICDEEDNATYVFNSTVLEERGISRDDLLQLTKPDLNDLIQNEPLLGKRIIYSLRFVTNMITAINNPQNGNGDDKETEGAGQYLRPKAPEEVLSLNGLYNKFKVAKPVILKAIDALGDDFGEMLEYRFRAIVVPGFSLEQQRKIGDWLEANGYHSVNAPEEVLSLNGLCRGFGVNHKTVTQAIEALRDELGEKQKYRFGPKRVTGYNSEQQRKIENWLEANGKLVENAPDGILSINGLHNKLGVAHHVIAKAIEALEDELGEISAYKFSTNVVLGFSLEQQRKIENWLEANGYLSVKAPEGVLNFSGLVRGLRVAHDTVANAIKTSRDELGETQKYRFGKSNITTGFNLKQQEQIRQLVESKRAKTKK